MTLHSVAIDRGDVGVRIDRVLLRHLTHVPGATRNRLQRLIESGAVEVNGRRVIRASARVAAGDRVTIELPERRPRATPAAEDLPLDVRYEDDDLVVVNKPAGQVSHPAFRSTSGTLLNALLAHAGGRWKPALLTRLDKGTSGLVLVAKSGAIQAALQRAGGPELTPATAGSRYTGIEKDYLAIVHGKPPARGTIDLALDRDPWDHRRVTVRDRGGVPSVTRFVRLKSAPAGVDGHISLLRCRLITGRTHQIRVHLAARGWPIVGDPVYRGGPGSIATATAKAIPAMTRQALHAWRLAFDHPRDGTRVEVTADPPADMQAVLPYSTRAMSDSTVPSAE